MRRTRVRLAGLLTLGAVVAAGPAAYGQLGTTPAPATQAAQTSYPVTPQAGPWMILAASYSGPDARQKAEELIQEIRAHYQRPAYGYNRAAEERRKEQERIAQVKELQRKWIREQGLPEDTPLRSPKTIRIEDQFAVLVGGYKDMDAARKDLDELRKREPPKKLQYTAYVPDANGRMHEEAVNPFKTAFVAPNPATHAEKSAADNKPDPHLKEYNADESYSLLKCRKPWTLVVKSYRGAAVVQAQSASSSVMEKLGMGKKAGELLNANAKAAHQVAEFLRKFGFEAYVLHTEYNSYVTIGAFDGGTDGPDDPKLEQMQRAFINEMSNPNSNVGQLHIKAQVGFFPQPLPMPVPQVK
jgi:hypothetical protein